jgi:hypothetical protein
MEPNIRLQPHLGRVHDNYKPHDNMGGLLAIAKVTKIHHKQGTVDLQVIKTNDVIASDAENEGKFGARVLTTSAHYDSTLMSSSGVVEPMQEGQLVLLAFVDGTKSNPIVLGSFHQTWNPEENILPLNYPLEPEDSVWDRREALKYLRVHPSQFYQRIDGIGAMEMSHPSKTFLQVDPDIYGEGINDQHAGYDHINLNERDPHFGTDRIARTEEASYPVNLLFVHRSHMDDTLTTWTKFFVNSQGMFRLTRDNNDGKLSYMQILESGAMSFRRQNDSPNHGEGKDYAQVVLDEQGSISLEKSLDAGTTSIGIDDKGDIKLLHSSGSYLVLDKDGVRGSSLSSGGGGGGSGGGVLGLYAGKDEPSGAPDGSIWIDTSDVEV